MTSGHLQLDAAKFPRRWPRRPMDENDGAALAVPLRLRKRQHGSFDPAQEAPRQKGEARAKAARPSPVSEGGSSRSHAVNLAIAPIIIVSCTKGCCCNR